MTVYEEFIDREQKRNSTRKIEQTTKPSFGQFAFNCLCMPVIVSALVAYSVLSYAFLLQHLWEWFAVPIFCLPQLSLLEAIGINILVGYFRNDLNETISHAWLYEREKKPSGSFTFGTVMLLLSPWILFCTSYLFHRFFM